MTIFSQVKEFSFLVGGLDLTENLRKFTLTRPHCELGTPQSWSGSFEIGQLLGQSDSLLDDRANPNTWRRAQQICVLTVLGSPVFTGYINTYRWNPNPLVRVGNGTLFDEIGLQSLANNKETKIEYPIAENTNTNLVKNILIAACNDADGTANFPEGRINVIDLEGGINIPFTASDLIGTAQKILGVNRVWLYCNSSGDMQTKAFDWGGGGLFSVPLSGVLTFDRDLAIEEYYAEKVVISGAKKVLQPLFPAQFLDESESDDLDANGRPTKVVTTNSKTRGELTENFSNFYPLNGGNALAVETVTKTIDYEYAPIDDYLIPGIKKGQLTKTTTTLARSRGILTGDFRNNAVNGGDASVIITRTDIETIYEKTLRLTRGELTGTFDNVEVNGFNPSQIIESIEAISNFSQNQAVGISNSGGRVATYVDTNAERRPLYDSRPLPVPDATIITFTFSGEFTVNLSYTPYFKVVDHRNLEYIESNQMCLALASFIARLEQSRVLAQLIEIPLSAATGWLSNPVPFGSCSVAGQSFVIDAPQIEMDGQQMKLIFTGLPV